MNKTITWLHISDTHFCEQKNNSKSKEISETFFDDIKLMEDEHGLTPDFIFFTGDIALGQKRSEFLFLKDQYKKAGRFIHQLLRYFSKKISNERIFLVPGNHDVNREIDAPEVSSLIDSHHQKGRLRPREIVNDLIQKNNKDGDKYRALLEDYLYFLKEQGLTHLLGNNDSLNYSKLCPINGYKIGIVGLNSAWSSSHGEDKGQLFLGTSQIDDSYDSIKDATFSIALIHHPPEWFNFIEERVKEEIVDKFNFILHGHEHSDWITSIDRHLVIASGALYSYGIGTEIGYNFVRLYPEDNRVEIFLRRYDGRGWINHSKAGITNSYGIYSKDKLRIIEKNVTSKNTKMEFLLIPAGKFMMGSPEEELERCDDEGPFHEVILKNSFYIGKYPVTQKQWEEVMKDNPSYFKSENNPVEWISWEDVLEFIQRMNDFDHTKKYRIPSEAEWEYACRADSKSRYFFGDNETNLKEHAWYDENTNYSTSPVGSKNHNLWGLYDMHGNVWEWVQDSYHADYEKAPSDGSAWEETDDSAKVIRGGCWFDTYDICRSAKRNRAHRRNRYLNLGVRIVRDL